MKVRATKMGFYQGRRRPGDVFDVPEAQVSKVWMERVGAPPSAAATTKAPEKAEAEKPEGGTEPPKVSAQPDPKAPEKAEAPAKK